MATNPPDIVAVILTKNEEINLERCIHSVRFCREIVVLDSGSTDRTEEIARRMGVHFLVHIQPPPFQISEQRNWVLDHFDFRGAWVLYVDADEVITLELRSRLLELVNGPTAHDHYLLTPRYMFLGRWLKRSIGYPNWHARLLRHGSTRFAGGVWEHFSSTKPSGYLHEPYDHYANSKGLSDWLARHDRYSSWDAKGAFEYLATGRRESLGTTRKVGIRRLAARFWPLRPLARFAHTYILRLGFMEGWQALVFSLLYAFYELMTVVKIIELRRQSRGEPL